MRDTARLAMVPTGTGQLLDEASLGRTLVRLAHEVAERHTESDRLVLAGIRTRGVPLAERLALLIGDHTGRRPGVIAVDVTHYRDDRPRAQTPPARALTATGPDTECRVDDAVVVLVDDVIQTGRSIRAGIDAVLGAGRPRSVELLVLIDRGQREMPLRPTFVGRNIPAAAASHIRVEMTEIDGRDGAWLVEAEQRS